MIFVRLDIPEIVLVKPEPLVDSRGQFAELFRADRFREAGLFHAYVQDNQSRSVLPGTVRGLHYQLDPAAQAKLVRVERGAIFDVAVDVRRGSPTFGRHVSVELTAEAGHMLLVPAGFAHGFCTLAPDTVVTYKVGAYYARELERGVIWNDPELGIRWPVTAMDAVVSAKDAVLPPLSACEPMEGVP